MNRHFLRFGIVALMTCVMFTACKKADVTATAADPQLTFALAPDNPVVTFAAAKTNSTGTITTLSTVTGKQAFSWYAGTANITLFRLNAKRGDLATVYSSGSLNSVDLFSLASLISTISIPKGDYSSVKATVVFSQVTAAPFPMVLLGTYTTAAGTNIPVEFDLNDNLEIGVTIPNFAANGTLDYTTNIAMHLNMFLTSIAASDIDAAARTNGVILINKTTNVTLYNKIKANMLVCGAAALTSKAK
jgi:hypothetical protein